MARTVDRAEAAGLGVAVGGHVLLFAILSLGLITAIKPVPPMTKAVEIQIVDEVGLADTVPTPSLVEPATSIAPEVGPPEPSSAPPPPEPVTRPLPTTA